MRALPITLALLLTAAAPAIAQEGELSPPAKASIWRMALSEAAIARYRSALALTAEQERFWPAAAAALRALLRMPQIDDEAVRRIAPAINPLVASLDDRQRQIAMDLARRAGLSQYAAMF